MLDFLRKNATGPLGIALIILLVFAGDNDILEPEHDVKNVVLFI